MLNGCLMQLASHCDIKLNNMRFSNSYEKINFDENILKINNDMDLVVPLYIIFEMDNIQNKEEFIKNMENSIITISLGYLILLEIDINFLTKLNPIKIINNNFIIKLPIDILIGTISCITMPFSAYQIKIVCEYNKIKNIFAIVEKIFLDMNERNIYMSNNIIQKKLLIKNMHTTNFNKEYNDYKYEITFDDINNKLGFFIKSEDNINLINICVENKLYSLNNCQIISDKLIFFSFYNLKYNDIKNKLINLINNNKTVYINSNISELKFYSYTFNIISYSNGSANLYSIYNDYYEIYFNYIKYNSCINISAKIPFLFLIKNIKVHNFINEYIDQNTYNNCGKDIKILRLFNSSFSSKLLINDNITTLILENCKTEITNIPFNIKEIWLINSVQQTNLPIGLEKLKIYNGDNNEKIKIPYGCQIEYVQY